VPIQQAGMGAASPPELVAAVSDAGAFGMLGTARAGLNATTFAALLEQTRKLTSRPFGVNFIMRPGSVPAATGEVEAMSLYAGESVGVVKRVLPAREVVRELVGQAEQLLQAVRSAARLDAGRSA
jgi:NAD(P)H-dependent flavin oxidoreductase YrpB (nitropropane dioxygenase family)